MTGAEIQASLVDLAWQDPEIQRFILSVDRYFFSSFSKVHVRLVRGSRENQVRLLFERCVMCNGEANGEDVCVPCRMILSMTNPQDLKNLRSCIKMIESLFYKAFERSAPFIPSRL